MINPSVEKVEREIKAKLATSRPRALEEAETTPAHLDQPPAPEIVKPRWDAERRELWYGELLCRKLRRGSDIEGILARFQMSNWEKSVSGVHEYDLKARIDSLNSGMEVGSRIKFYRDNSLIGFRIRNSPNNSAEI
jgi:hypothetical protein